MDWLNDSTLATASSVLGAALLFLLRQFAKDRAATYEARFAQGVAIAYAMVNELAQMTETKIDDKAAQGLYFLRQYLETHGLKLTEMREAEAKMQFRALHGAERMATDLALSAAPMVLGNPSAPRS